MNKNAIKNQIISLLYLTAGAVIAAFAIEEFLAPNAIFDGGVVGTAMILDHFTSIRLGTLIVILNIPFVILCYRVLGRITLVKYGYALIVFSLMTEVFKDMPNMTEEIILAMAFGGLILGAGVGLVLRGGGCLDGTEILAVILNRNTSYSVGQIILAFNVVIYFFAGLVFGPDRGMYSLLMYIITSKVIDAVEVGGNSAFSVMIITDNGREMADHIYAELGRTVTFMHGEGYLSSESKDILYCVVTRAEIFDIKKLVAEMPGSTFSTISEVSEIIGEHIKGTHSEKSTLQSDHSKHLRSPARINGGQNVNIKSFDYSCRLCRASKGR